MSWIRLVTVARLATWMAAAPAWAQSAPEESAADVDGSPPLTLTQTPPAVPAPADLDPDDRMSRLVPRVARDLGHFPSLGTAVILGLGGAMGAVAHQNDDYFTRHASAGGTDTVFAVGGALGNGVVQGGAALATFTVGRLTRHPAAAHLGADLMRAQLVTGILTQGIKLAVKRDRPEDAETGHVGTHSVPSGHAATSWASATVLWRHGGWKAGVPASLVAAFVSASRLQENQHYMSDVLFGAALGIASARTVTLGHGAARFTVVPAPVRGGGAVMVSLAGGR
ncbi:MAG: phosphatase PAP2 family protein [Vicinamibacterales bacterium]